MGILQEKSTRMYVMFLVYLTGSLILLTFFLSWFHGKETGRILLEREQTIVSSLMEEEISPVLIAGAIKNTETTGEGIALLRKMGHTDAVSVRLFPDLDSSVRLFAWVSACMAVLMAVMLIGMTALFLWKREKLYRQAESVIIQFSEGNFENHLPRNENGSIYQLFAAVEELAVALRAESEKEQSRKVFLKDTISDISHQLKTPLAAMHMYTEIIAREPDHVETVVRFSGKSMQAMERIEQLVQALLKVSRIDAGSILFQKEKLPVPLLVADALEDLSVRAQAEGKRIVLQGDSKEEMLCDRQWTREAVANLIKNALDHTEEDGVITVSWERSPAMLSLSVADDGCGIAKEDIHHVFKRFYRSKQEGGRAGIGLGLPLAKAIVEGQGGMLSVDSARGQGAVFTIFLTVL